MSQSQLPPSNATPKTEHVGNVKIYDRPERKGLSPVAIVLLILVLLFLAYVGYRFFF